MKTKSDMVWLIVMLTILASYSVFVGISFQKDVLTKEYSDAYDYTDNFEKVTSEFDAEIIENIANECRRFVRLPDRMLCVNQFVKQSFAYVPHDDNKIYGATKLFSDGGMCIDYANFYCDMAEKLHYTCAYGFTPTHIFSIVGNGDFYCDMDMELMNCYQLGGSQDA